MTDIFKDLESLTLARLDSYNSTTGMALLTSLDGAGAPLGLADMCQPMLGVDPILQQAYGIVWTPTPGTVVIVGKRDMGKLVVLGPMPIAFSQYGLFGLNPASINGGEFIIRTPQKMRISFTADGMTIVTDDTSSPGNTMTVRIGQDNNISIVNAGDVSVLDFANINISGGGGGRIWVDSVDNVTLSNIGQVGLSEVKAIQIDNSQKDGAININVTGENSEVNVKCDTIRLGSDQVADVKKFLREEAIEVFNEHGHIGNMGAPTTTPINPSTLMPMLMTASSDPGPTETTVTTQKVQGA